MKLDTAVIGGIVLTTLAYGNKTLSLIVGILLIVLGLLGIV